MATATLTQLLNYDTFERMIGTFMCYCGNTGVERTNRSQHRKLSPRKTLSRGFCRDSNLRPFNHESSALSTELSSLPSDRQRDRDRLADRDKTDRQGERVEMT